MEFEGITYSGPPSLDEGISSRLPSVLRDILSQLNGFIALGGAFHVRGACSEPRWHSLAEVWHGQYALSEIYPAVQQEDLPFAQDYLGNQFVLRCGEVWKLEGETGKIHQLGLGLQEFLAELSERPSTHLDLHFLAQFGLQGGVLHPGELLHVYPPQCTEEAKAGVSLHSVPALRHLAYLGSVARQLARLPPGAKIRFTTDSQASHAHDERGSRGTRDE